MTLTIIFIGLVSVMPSALPDQGVTAFLPNTIDGSEDPHLPIVFLLREDGVVSRASRSPRCRGKCGHIDSTVESKFPKGKIQEVQAALQTELFWVPYLDRLSIDVTGAEEIRSSRNDFPFSYVMRARGTFRQRRNCRDTNRDCHYVARFELNKGAPRSCHLSHHKRLDSDGNPVGNELYQMFTMRKEGNNRLASRPRPAADAIWVTLEFDSASPLTMSAKGPGGEYKATIKPDSKKNITLVLANIDVSARCGGNGADCSMVSHFAHYYDLMDPEIEKARMRIPHKARLKGEYPTDRGCEDEIDLIQGDLTAKALFDTFALPHNPQECLSNSGG